MISSYMRKTGKKAAIYTIIQHNVKKYRTAAGMTQKALGLALKYDEETAQQRINQYEKGRRSPSHDTVEEMSKILNVPFIAFYFKDYEGLKTSGQISPALDRQIEFLVKQIVQKVQKEEAA